MSNEWTAMFFYFLFPQYIFSLYLFLPDNNDSKYSLCE